MLFYYKGELIFMDEFNFSEIKKKRKVGFALVILGLGLIYILLQSNRSFDFISYLSILAAIILIFFGIVMAGTELQIENIEKLPESSTEIEQAITQLNRNYNLLRDQTSNGFSIAVIFMFLGLIVILIGSLSVMFGYTSKSDNLTLIAGIILEFISGASLVIYDKNFKRLNLISDNLNETWKILAAFKKAETLTDGPDDIRTKVKIDLINALIGSKVMDINTKR